ncbi:hypothetical protein COT64_00370 [Candidatus Shapirobacteria bacterium CG09_land_8_20_14_0_10_39_12]|uniref:Glycosyl transferase family 1 domain-containing protein n=1 Tax=Candidatus Shapirobacteria bacterium CG09_land_8_20_14_0_10_39_12 TaxID=1974885 RepID=A0A2H0WQH1_9BACT|nr:MAG: hypothetical protein COT64_00370 [Candidatus Shapirobacteria bacterium CG09_land_8_20_14_0_10_39_12]
MKIGILTHNFPKNEDDRKDAGVFLRDFAAELEKKREVYIYKPRLDDKLGSWHLFSPLSLLRFVKLVIRGRKEAVDFAIKNKLDYCLAVWAIPSGVFALGVKKALHIPYAVWCLGSDINFYARIPVLKQIIKSVLKNADRVFANSLFLKDKVEALVGKKCTFLPAVTKIHGSRIVRKSQSDIVKFLYVGRLERVKGIDILLNALSKVDKKYFGGWKLDVLGGGTLMRNLKSNNFVKFHNWADEEKVVKFMKASNCLIIPSRSESLPLVLLEAAQFNLPIITSDVGDCPYIIKKYNIGWVFKRGSVYSLARRLEDFLKEGEKKKMETDGFLKLRRDFSQKVSVRKFLSEIT